MPIANSNSTIIPQSTRMAASEVGGCVSRNENNTSKENVKCVESEKKTENGKVHHGKNGYVKSKLITNGIHVSSMGYYFTNVIYLKKKSPVPVFLCW